LTPGALIRLSGIELNVELRKMIHHKGTKDTKVSADRLSYDIVGAAIEVHKHLGPGLLESAYEACLSRELTRRGIDYERQVSLPIQYYGLSVDCGYRLDLIIGGLVVVEVKSVAKVHSIHKAQVLTYLKLLRMNLGLILNFNVEVLRLGIYRIVLG
jgi:GxxExxY protein